MPKSIENTFMFKLVPDYGKNILYYINNAERIDKSSDVLDDIIFDIKRRRISNSLTKVLTSNNTVLAITSTPLPKAFRTFVAKDTQDNSKPKMFIDCTNMLTMVNGKYECKDTDLVWLISHIVAGSVYYIYALAPNKVLLDNVVISSSCTCFGRLFTYIIDRLYKITSTPILRSKVEYLSIIYYQICHLGKDYKSESAFRNVRNMAFKLVDIDDRDAAAIDLMIDDGDFDNINTFTKALSRIFNFKDISTGMIVGEWMKNFTPGTQFSLEFFPSLSMMLTHAYMGGYLNNQNLIEKICGKPMIEFSKAILRIIDSV